MLAPCKECTERVLGCHSTCEKYKAFQDECKRVREIVQKQKKVDDDWWRVTSSAYRKRKR